MLRWQSIRRSRACMPVAPHPFPRQTPWRRFRPAASLIQIPFRREFKTTAPVSLVADHVPLGSSSLPRPSSPIINPSLFPLLSFLWSRSVRPARSVHGDSWSFTFILATVSISLSVGVLSCSHWYRLLRDSGQMEDVGRSSEGSNKGDANQTREPLVILLYC